MALTERKCGVSGKRCSLASETLSTLLLPSPRASYPCRRSAEDAEQLFKNSNFLRDRLDQTAMCTVTAQITMVGSHLTKKTLVPLSHYLRGKEQDQTPTRWGIPPGTRDFILGLLI